MNLNSQLILTIRDQVLQKLLVLNRNSSNIESIMYVLFVVFGELAVVSTEVGVERECGCGPAV